MKSLIYTSRRFHQTFFTKAFKKTSAHKVFQKICCSISPLIDFPDFMLKSYENSTNLCSICQALFAKKASHLALSRKSLVKIVGEINPIYQTLFFFVHR
jgi:hypothetical protein